VYGTENSNVRIIVRAKKNSWIQVRDDVANQLLLARLLRSGDSYRVPNRAGLKLLAGNVGALEILVDGKSVPSIGPQGAVRRSVALDAARLLEGKAVIE
jgi:cytoskeleton protein RodZ